MPRRSLNAVAAVNEVVVVLAIVLDLGITFANTIARYGFNSGIHFAEDTSAILIGVITWLS